MRRVSRSTRSRPAWMVTMLTLSIAVGCVLAMPPAAFAQRIPEPGKPTVVATPCPSCGKWVDTPGGRIPAKCPHCGSSLSGEGSQPTFAPARKKQPARPTDPYAGQLFFGEPIQSGGASTGPDDLAARSEEWAKQMKQVDEQSRKKQEAQKQEFERSKKEALGTPGGSGLQLRNVYAEPGKTGPTPRLLRNPYGSGDAEAASGTGIGAELTEHQQIQRLSDQARYAHMRPEELDAVAAQYPGNAEIQKTIAGLKARIRSMDALAETSEQTRRAQEIMTFEQQKGNREAARAAATILDLTAGIPQGLDEVYYNEKTMAQWAGIDVASSRIQDGINDYTAQKAESYVLRKGWNTPGPVKALGGIGSIIDGATSVEDLVSLAQTANKAGDHYVNAAELRAQLKASGGTNTAVGNWSYVRNQALNDSARLDRLIHEEETRK